MTENLTSTSWVIFFKVLSVIELCPIQFVKCLTKRKISKDICPVNKEKLFPALCMGDMENWKSNCIAFLFIWLLFASNSHKLRIRPSLLATYLQQGLVAMACNQSIHFVHGIVSRPHYGCLFVQIAIIFLMKLLILSSTLWKAQTDEKTIEFWIYRETYS